MYGKLFASLYTGSMVGSGPLTFAVWSYVIANQVPDKQHGMWVELNPKLIALIVGQTTEAEVRAVIETLCSPDPASRSKEAAGARLKRLGEYAYQVVNGKRYREIRDQEQRREQNRLAQERFRKKSKPLDGEVEAVKAYADGDDEKFNKLAEPNESSSSTPD